MTRITKTNTTSPPQQSSLPVSTAPAETPDFSQTQTAWIMTRLTQRASAAAQPQTSAPDFKSLVLESVSGSQAFQSHNLDTQNLISKLIGDVDLTELNQQKTLTFNVIQSAIDNIIKLIDLDSFRKASPNIQKEMLNALLMQPDSTFLINKLAEITGTPSFQMLNSHLQKVIVGQIAFAVAGVVSDKEAQPVINNIKELIESVGFKDSSPETRARMLEAVNRAKDARFTNALIRVSGDPARFKQLNESQKYKYIDLVKQVFDQKRISRLFVDVTDKVVEEVNQQIDKELGKN